MENSTENSTEPNWTIYEYLDYRFNFVRIILYALCCLGNLLTLTAVIKYDSLHKKPTNILILSLAVADGLLGFNSITIILKMFYHGADPVSEVTCLLHMWFNRASITGNITTFSLISIERFLAIFFPLKSMIWITATKTIKLVFLLWILITCQTTLEVVLGGHYDSAFLCIWRAVFSKDIQLSMAIMYAVYSLSPFILNTAIFLKVKFRNRLGSNISKTSRKTTKMMAIIIGTYYGFYLPAFLDYLLDHNPKIKPYLEEILGTIFHFNAIANPLIYAWMNKEFNIAFRKILRIKSPSNSNIQFASGTQTAQTA